VPADLLFIGEAPGRSENVVGLPFVGPSGKFLDKMISDAAALTATSNLPSYFITNTILCRPCDSFQGANREPDPHEVLSCSVNLQAIINEVAPIIVILIGKIAQKYFSDEFHEFVSINHPAFLLRTGATGSPWYQTNINILASVLRGR
jgi:DNA polymerase